MNNDKYIIRTTRLSVMPPTEPLNSECCTHISIKDETAGEFIEIEQQSGHVGAKNQTIEVNPFEWPTIRNAVDALFGMMEEHKLRQEKKNRK